MRDRLPYAPLLQLATTRSVPYEDVLKAYGDDVAQDYRSMLAQVDLLRRALDGPAVTTTEFVDEILVTKWDVCSLGLAELSIHHAVPDLPACSRVRSHSH